MIKNASEGSTLAFKPRADVTRRPKVGYQWSHKKDLGSQCSPEHLPDDTTNIISQSKFPLIKPLTNWFNKLNLTKLVVPINACLFYQAQNSRLKHQT